MLDLIKKFKVAFIIKDLRKTVFIELKNGMIIFQQIENIIKIQTYLK